MIGRRLDAGTPRFHAHRRKRPTPLLRLSSQAGDTLLEVLISALLLGVVVVGTFSGLNSTNRSTSISRARSQADALAEQNQEQLRSLPVSALKKLEQTPGTKTVTQNGTKYLITERAEFRLTNGTSSCASAAVSAEYIETSSTVTSLAFGTGKPVVETGIVSPPPGTSLVAQVTGPSGAAVAGMTVHITGPESASAVTSTGGCAVIAGSPGEYNVNVSQPFYVDQNWWANSEDDSFYPKSVYLAAQNTTKESYIFAPAAQLTTLTLEELNPSTGLRESAKALNAILENALMSPTTRSLRPAKSSTYVASIGPSEKRVFPFLSTAPYTVYAGTCSANKPPEAERTKVVFPSGGEASAKLLLPSLFVRVWKGTATTPETLVTTVPEVLLADTDSGCDNASYRPETVLPTESKGALKYPGQPFGTYTVCTNVTFNGEKKHFSATGQKNLNAKQTGTIVNLYAGGPKGEGLTTGSCP